VPQFTDNRNRAWQVAITVLDVKRLRENLDIQLTDPESLSALFDSEETQYEVLWYLLEKQAEAYGLDAVAFATVYTENFTVISEALVESIKLFFRQTGRPELNNLISKILNASTRLRGIVEKNLSSEKFDSVLTKLVEDQDQRISKALDEQLTKIITSSSESQGSSESSLGALPSES